MGARVIASADKHSLAVLDGTKGINDVFAPGPCRIVFRSDDDKVIVHDFPPVLAISGGNVFFFRWRGMNQKHVHITVLAKLQGFAGSGCRPF